MILRGTCERGDNINTHLSVCNYEATTWKCVRVENVKSAGGYGDRQLCMRNDPVTVDSVTILCKDESESECKWAFIDDQSAKVKSSSQH